jgi:hypothetical protein
MTSSYVKLARFRKPKAACFLSYVEYRPNTNTNNSMKNGSCLGGWYQWEERRRWGKGVGG